MAAVLKTAAGELVDLELTLEEISQVLRRPLQANVTVDGGSSIISSVWSVAELQAKIFRALHTTVRSLEVSMIEMQRDLWECEKARNGRNAGHAANDALTRSTASPASASNLDGQRLTEFAEILAGHGTLLSDLQQQRREDATRRRSWQAETEQKIQGILARLDDGDATATEVKRALAIATREAKEVAAVEPSLRSKITKCKDEMSDLWKLHEELSARHNESMQDLYQRQEVQYEELVKLQRWVADRQRHRVQKLEAELAQESEVGRSPPPAHFGADTSFGSGLEGDEGPSRPRGFTFFSAGASTGGGEGAVGAPSSGSGQDGLSPTSPAWTAAPTSPPNNNATNSGDEKEREREREKEKETEKERGSNGNCQTDSSNAPNQTSGQQEKDKNWANSHAIGTGFSRPAGDGQASAPSSSYLYPIGNQEPPTFPYFAEHYGYSASPSSTTNNTWPRATIHTGPAREGDVVGDESGDAPRFGHNLNRFGDASPSAASAAGTPAAVAAAGAAAVAASTTPAPAEPVALAASALPSTSTTITTMPPSSNTFTHFMPHIGPTKFAGAAKSDGFLQDMPMTLPRPTLVMPEFAPGPTTFGAEGSRS